MAYVKDAAGVEGPALNGLVDFTGKRVFEIGCGDGHMIRLFAGAAASVVAFDPDESAIALARERTPASVAAKVEFRTGGLLDVDLPEESFDIGLFAWSI